MRLFSRREDKQICDYPAFRRLIAEQAKQGLRGYYEDFWLHRNPQEREILVKLACGEAVTENPDLQELQQRGLVTIDNKLFSKQFVKLPLPLLLNSLIIPQHYMQLQLFSVYGFIFCFIWAYAIWPAFLLVKKNAVILSIFPFATPRYGNTETNKEIIWSIFGRFSLFFP